MALKYRFGMSQFRNRCPNCFDVNTIRQASGVDVFWTTRWLFWWRNNVFSPIPDVTQKRYTMGANVTSSGREFTFHWYEIFEWMRGIKYTRAYRRHQLKASILGNHVLLKTETFKYCRWDNSPEKHTGRISWITPSSSSRSINLRMFLRQCLCLCGY